MHADDDEITSDESTEEENSVLEDNQRDFPQNADMSDTEAAISTRSSPRLQELNSVSRSGLYIGSDNESLAEELRFLYEPEAQEIEDNSNSSIVTDRISIANALKGISIQGDCSSVSASYLSDTQESFGEGPSFSHLRSVSPMLQSEGNSQQTLDRHIADSRREIKISSYFKSSTSKDINTFANNNLLSKSL